MLRRFFILAICSSLSPLALASAEAPEEGKDFTILSTPVQTQNPKKIEVISFFAYTCPHCYSYEKVIEPWAANLPADVDFRRVPVAWTEKNFPFSKTYYALEAMNKLDPFHEIMFDAVIKQGKDFDSLNDIADFLASQGLDKKEFLKAANSFSTNMKNEKAFKTWQAYNIDGTPANAINGKYITAPHMVGTREGAIKVMDKLIEKERSQKAGK